MLVVVHLVGRKDLARVGFSDDEDVVEDLAPDTADDPFAVGVRPGRSRCTRDHSRFLGFGDGVGRLVVLAVTVAQQEAKGLHPRSGVGGGIPGLLYGPRLRRMGGDTGDVRAPGAVFEEHHRGRTFAECGVDVDEVCRDDALGLAGGELAPGGTAATWWLEVMRLVGLGFGNDDIARKLVISPATVRTHVSRTMMKLGARDRVQLVVFAYQWGVVAPA